MIRSAYFQIALVLTVALDIVGAPALASAGDGHRLDPLLKIQSRQLSGKSRVIVEFKDASDLRAITDTGGVPLRPVQGGHAAEVDNLALEQLARDPRVSRVVHDRAAFATLERTGAAVGLNVARQQFDLTGEGVGIAIIDSGITSWHDDLYLTGGRSGRRDHVVHFRDFTRGHHRNVWSSDAPSDEFGHGTHVAGIVAGSGYDSSGQRSGIAPGAQLIGLKVLDANGVGYISDVIAAIDYAIAAREQFNIRVINLSVASGVFESYQTDPLTRAALRAVRAGIVVVTSAGNLGVNTEGQPQFGGITSPGNAPWVITVGAASHQGSSARGDDLVARFSSRGPTLLDRAAKPDLVAYGVGVESLADQHSALYSMYPELLLDGTRNVGYRPYLSLTGTSMAAPVVSATIALMLEANPSLTPNAVKAILEYTAEHRGESVIAQGAGLVNARGATRLARYFADPRRNLGPTGDTIEGEWTEWSQHVLWGNTLRAGGVLLPGSNAWSQSVTWGDTRTATGSPVVWGAASDDNIVWSTRHDDNIVWSTRHDDNIVWSTRYDDNIVWSTRHDDNIVWSTRHDDNIVWSTAADDNIVWSTGADDNIVWSTYNDDNIVWSTYDDDNIVWSTYGDDNIVWSTGGDDNIVWSTGADDNIVWSTYGDDNIVWSTRAVDQVVWPAAAAVIERRRGAAPRY